VSAVERLLQDAPSPEITDPAVLARIATILRARESELVSADLDSRPLRAAAPVAERYCVTEPTNTHAASASRPCGGGDAAA
jgi:hypothetical protein